MNFPDFSTKEVVGLRFFSSINPWLDFVVFVRKSSVKKTAIEIMAAMNTFWEGKVYETYGDALEHTITDPCLILYHDSEDASQEYEEKWERLLDCGDVVEVSAIFEVMRKNN